MKLVKIFSEASDLALEREINLFIRERQEINMEEVDIQYKVFIDEKGHEIWTAMVIHGR